MNERIEHLMYLAGLTAQGCWDKLDDYDRNAIEKFAELIVRECIERVGVYRVRMDSSPANIIQDIKEHFGVE